MRYCKDCGAPIEAHGPVPPLFRRWVMTEFAGRWPRDTRRECPTQVVRVRTDRSGNRVPISRVDPARLVLAGVREPRLGAG